MKLQLLIPGGIKVTSESQPVIIAQKVVSLLGQQRIVFLRDSEHNTLTIKRVDTDVEPILEFTQTRSNLRIEPGWFGQQQKLISQYWRNP